MFLKFPEDWTVNGFFEFDWQIQTVSQNCNNDGSPPGLFTGGVNWTDRTGAEYALSDNRIQEPGDYCHAVYCFDVADTGLVTDPALESAAVVSWSWLGGESETPPIRPCSDDGYYGPTNVPPCDETSSPRLPCRSAITCRSPFCPRRCLLERPAFPTKSICHRSGKNTWRLGKRFPPEGLTLSYNTGQIYWSAPTLGSHKFTVVVASGLV